MSEEAAAAIGDIAYWQQRANAAEAEGAELRRLIFARRNVGLRLAVPGSPHWQEVMRDLQAAETALYDAAERRSAGQALLAEIAFLREWLRGECSIADVDIDVALAKARAEHQKESR